MQLNPYSTYRQTAVETASPERLVLMLYDGALKFLHQAEEAARQNKIEEVNNHLSRVQDIVNEFIVTLDMNTGEIAVNLRHIYEYWNRRLVEANVKKDLEAIVEVAGQVKEIRDTWANMITGHREGQPKAVGGVNIEG